MVLRVIFLSIDFLTYLYERRALASGADSEGQLETVFWQVVSICIVDNIAEYRPYYAMIGSRYI